MRLNEFEMLPELAFRPRGGYGKFGAGMTLEGGKGGSSAPTPDPNIGIAQRQLADLADAQWASFKTDIYPELLRQSKVAEERANQQFAMTKEVSDFNLGQARKAYARYEEGAIPAMQKLKEDADKYNEAGYQEMLAGQALGDVNVAFEAQRQQQAMRDRSYGVDPTSGRSAGSTNAIGAMQALAGAQASTQTRQAAKDIGLTKQANVYNMYAGLPAQANANTNIALGASNQGIAGGKTAFDTVTGVGASLNAGANTAMQGWNQVGSLGVGKYNADVSAYNAEQQASGAFASGLGSALGSGAALWKMGAFAAPAASDIRIKQNVRRLGTLDNGLPFYAFEYKPEYQATWGHGVQLGVMAHEVEPLIPDAVSLHADGYKLVDYAKVMNHGI